MIEKSSIENVESFVTLSTTEDVQAWFNSPCGLANWFSDYKNNDMSYNNKNNSQQIVYSKTSLPRYMVVLERSKTNVAGENGQLNGSGCIEGGELKLYWGINYLSIIDLNKGGEMNDEELSPRGDPVNNEVPEGFGKNRRKIVSLHHPIANRFSILISSSIPGENNNDVKSLHRCCIPLYPQSPMNQKLKTQPF